MASGAPRAKGNWRARQLHRLYPGFCALLSQGRMVDLATSEVLPIVSLLETHGGIASVRDRHLIFNQLDYLEVIFRHLTLSELGTVCVCVNKTWASAVFGLRPEEAAWAAPASADPWADWDARTTRRTSAPPTELACRVSHRRPPGRLCDRMKQ